MTRLAEWKDHLTTVGKEHRAALRDHYRIQGLVGEQAKTVLGHPGWEMYVQHLNVIKTGLEEKKASLAREMTEGLELGEGLSRHKLVLAQITGELRGLSIALEIIPGMIEAGERATRAAIE